MQPVAEAATWNDEPVAPWTVGDRTNLPSHSQPMQFSFSFRIRLLSEPSQTLPHDQHRHAGHLNPYIVFFVNVATFITMRTLTLALATASLLYELRIVLLYPRSHELEILFEADQTFDPPNVPNRSQLDGNILPTEWNHRKEPPPKSSSIKGWAMDWRQILLNSTSTNTHRDHRICTSPEYQKVTWPLNGTSSTSTITPSFSCGMDPSQSSSFGDYYRNTIWKQQILPLANKEQCRDMVIFGVAFGAQFVRQLISGAALQTFNATKLVDQQGPCFFMFTSIEDMVDAGLPYYKNNSAGSVPLTSIRTENLPFWWIPIPSNYLPYVSPRRNAKLLKYAGHFLFPNTSTIIWQDAKFFRQDMVDRQPRNYQVIADASHDTCLTAVGLPVHPNTVGNDHPSPHSLRLKHRYAWQCHAVVEALRRRPNVTDSPTSLMYQCLAYLSDLQHNLDTTSRLDYGLVDTAFLIWNEATKRCRSFNAELRCTVLDQLHCHSDRDQINFPYSLYRMGVTGYYTPFRYNKTKEVDQNWDPRSSDVEYYLNSELHRARQKQRRRRFVHQSLQPTVRIARYNCHWYRNRLGEGCRFWNEHHQKA